MAAPYPLFLVFVRITFACPSPHNRRDYSPFRYVSFMTHNFFSNLTARQVSRFCPFSFLSDHGDFALLVLMEFRS